MFLAFDLNSSFVVVVCFEVVVVVTLFVVVVVFKVVLLFVVSVHADNAKTKTVANKINLFFHKTTSFLFYIKSFLGI